MTDTKKMENEVGLLSSAVARLEAVRDQRKTGTRGDALIASLKGQLAEKQALLDIQAPKEGKG